MTFQLDERLAGDTVEIANLALCYVGLMQDARFPWLILVPRKANLVELTDLSRDDRALLMDEAAQCSIALSDVFEVDKVNVAALGNIVSQLHVHVVGRRKTDAAWPQPVWGNGTPEPYADHALRDINKKIRAALGDVSL